MARPSVPPEAAKLPSRWPDTPAHSPSTSETVAPPARPSTAPKQIQRYIFFQPALARTSQARKFQAPNLPGEIPRQAAPAEQNYKAGSRTSQLSGEESVVSIGRAFQCSQLLAQMKSRAHSLPPVRRIGARRVASAHGTVEFINRRQFRDLAGRMFRRSAARWPSLPVNAERDSIHHLRIRNGPNVSIGNPP